MSQSKTFEVEAGSVTQELHFLLFTYSIVWLCSQQNSLERSSCASASVEVEGWLRATFTDYSVCHEKK